MSPETLPDYESLSPIHSTITDNIFEVDGKQFFARFIRMFIRAGKGKPSGRRIHDSKLAPALLFEIELGDKKILVDKA